MKYWTLIAAGLALASSGRTLAGEQPLYAPAPSWVQVADVEVAAKAARGPSIVFDRQVKIDGERTTAYFDTALRLDTPQALTQFGTLGTVWLPDKGDLTVHRAELVRDGKTIDLLAGGDRFTVIRREQQLEQRVLDGMLTATLPVAGARLGDIVRLSYSVTRVEPALLGNVERIDGLPTQPFASGLARLILIWPSDRQLSVAGSYGVSLPAPIDSGGEKRLTIALPLAKPKELPQDAPSRFGLPPQLRVTSFAAWEEVSKAFAPLYDTAGKAAASPALKAEVAEIAKATSDPVERMTRALRVVQDRISYLANGMNGGNYVPQSPAQTWSARYGDCKAKTLLLLTMLAELGIEAEPVLVNSAYGDAVASAPPMAAAFDHVIVRARSGGRDFWLDGTIVGTRAASLSDTPPFRWGLPITARGAVLTPIEARAPAAPWIVMRTELDQSAGIDFPVLFKGEMLLAGPLAASLQPLLSLAPGKERDEAIDNIVVGALGESQILERSLSGDASAGTMTVAFRGLQTTPWKRNERRAVYIPRLAASEFNFAPDRSRPAWREIPVELGAANRTHFELNVLLPEKGRGIVMENPDFASTLAGSTIKRSSRIADGRLIVSEDIAAAGGELAPQTLANERGKAAALKAATLRLRAPADAYRNWEVATPAARKALKPIEDAYAKLIAADPNAAEGYSNRASFLWAIRDHRAAHKDLTQVVALDPTADNYDRLADLNENLGDFAGAIADLRKAEDIAPEARRAGIIAELLGRDGKPAEGLAIVEEALQNPGESKADLVSTRAELLARLGRKDQGLAALDELLEDRPGDATIFNQRCWYRSLWMHGLDAVLADCNRALEGTSWPAAVLDSRALAQFRLGNLTAALADANTALDQDPGQTATLLLRGIIRKKLGQSAGDADISEALRRNPGLKRQYESYGLLP